MVFGYGNSQYAASHGRPVWKTREHGRAHDGEDRHRLGEAADRHAPLLPEQEQDRGDQRAGVTDADPPDEVDDGEAPADGNVDPQMPVPLISSQLMASRNMDITAKAMHEPDEPSGQEPRPQHRRRDLVGDRAERMPWTDDVRVRPRHSRGMRLRVRFQGRLMTIGHKGTRPYLSACVMLLSSEGPAGGGFGSAGLGSSCRGSSGRNAAFGFLISARYVVRGRVFRSASTP